MISRLVLLGATGDLAGRFLLPALAGLRAGGQLPDGVEVVAAGQQDWDDETFRKHAAGRLQEHAGDVPGEVRDRLLRGLRYIPVDFAQPESVVRAVRAVDPGRDGIAGRDGEAVAVYLALPQALFPAAIAALGAADLPAGSRIAVEKPFGQDRETAQALNTLLAGVTAGRGEKAVFRVDHALGMLTVEDLRTLREGPAGLEPYWDGTRIGQVDVLWEETLGLEGRAAFYDRAGAVRDVMQNHMLQVLALVTTELPAGADLHRAKTDLLKAVRPLDGPGVTARTRRARYRAGRLASSGAPVPDYRQEQGVDPGRGTETYAELVLELDLPRWAGTRFVLRAGKALAAGHKGVMLHFREPVSLPGVSSTPVERLWIELDAPAAGRPEEEPQQPAVVAAPVPVRSELTAYTQVLLDLLSGGDRLSVSGAEAEESWRIVDPVLRAWAGGAVPLLEYAAGSDGPGLLDPGR